VIELWNIPRPGFWVRQSDDPAAILDAAADGRVLTQEQTDILIEIQIWSHFGWNEDATRDAELRSVIGYDFPREGIWGARLLGAFPTSLGFVHSPRTTPTRQRGGIHTSAAVRMLARMAWGDRDLIYRGPIDTRDNASVRFALLELK
jgi:hypothetical protein